MPRVLVTGDAGFIGSHLCDVLLARGYDVRALDNLDPQVHGGAIDRPAYLNRDVELLIGDVRDPDAIARALDGVDMVCHLAAAVGVGQSMYEIARYVAVNDLGTATLLEGLTHHPVQRLVVASSMSVYGEGAYVRVDGDPGTPVPRDATRMRRGDWEVRDARGCVLWPVATTEDKPVALASVYAASKYATEQLALSVCEAYDIPVIALRMFNVYGTRQALSNPYTGVLAIFASRLLNKRSPTVFEDGEQRRDFVSVHDVVDAWRLAVEAPPDVTGVFNIGSGVSSSVSQIARRLAASLGCMHLAPELTGKFRVGDVRHCFASIDRARHSLGYEPRHTIDRAMPELIAWLATQRAEDHTTTAGAELASRGLTR